MSNQGWGAPPPGGPPVGGGSGFGPPAGGFGAPAGPPAGGFGAPAGPPGGYPGAAPGTPFGAGGGTGMAEPWGAWEAVMFAWDRIKGDPGTILGALIVGGLISNAISGVGQGIASVDKTDQTLQLVSQGLSVLNSIVSIFMTGGMTLFSIKVAKGEHYEFGDIFKGGPFFWSILGSGLLVGLGVLFGLLLLIVPGVILALAFTLTTPLIVDKEMGAIDAMKESWRLMDGQKGGMFVFGLLGFGMVLVGMLACCLPVLVVGPIMQIAFAFVYLRITGQKTAELSM